MANKALFQVFAKREALPGVLESTLIAAANGDFLFKDPQLTYDVESFEREVKLASISPLTALTGGTQGQFTFACELAGSSTALPTAPSIGLLLEACGMRAGVLYGGTWSGTFTGTASGTAKHFYHGQIVRNAAGTNTYRVVHDTYEGQTTFYCELVTGAVTAEAVYPSTSDATIGPVLTVTGGSFTTQKGIVYSPVSLPIITATASSTTGTQTSGDVYVGQTTKCVIQSQVVVANGTGVAFRILDGAPQAAAETYDNVTAGGANNVSLTTWAQTDFPSLSMGLIEDGRIKQLKGCRGTFSLSAERGKAALLNFTFKGLVASTVNGGPISGISYTQRVPPRFFGSNLGFLLGSYKTGEPGYYSHATAHTPRVNAVTLDLGGQTNLQEDATQTTGYVGTGQPALRSSQGSITIETRPESLYPIISKLTNSEPLWLKMQLKNSSTRNNFMISVPGIVGTGASPGEQNGFARDEFAFRMSTYRPDTSDGDQRELVITYLDSSAATW